MKKNDNFHETISKKILILIRHGERIDRAGEIPKCGIMNPELTEKGKLQSFKASEKIMNNLKKYGIKEISPNIIQIRSSPYMRTIQTSVQLLKGLNLLFPNDKKEKSNILNRIYIDFGLRKRIKPLVVSLIDHKLIGKNDIPMDIKVHQYINGYVALLQYYLRHGYDLAPEIITEYYLTLYK